MRWAGVRVRVGARVGARVGVRVGVGVRVRVGVGVRVRFRVRVSPQDLLDGGGGDLGHQRAVLAAMPVEDTPRCVD